jgi:hypothetical protein
MYESTEASDAEVKFEAAERGSAKSIRSFCKSLVRRIHLGPPTARQEHDKTAAANAPRESHQPVPVKRVTKHGSFDWGSFSAFEDGSIEVERAGVKQWFPNLSELKRSLNQGTAPTGGGTA